MRVLDSRFELGNELGRGGMAEVFEATDLRLGRRVAVKLLSLELRDPGARQRFEREARALSGLVHPNAIVIFDAGLDGDQPYLVMELVEGPTLAEHLRTRGVLSVRSSTTIATHVLAALGAAHDRGIVHRDVKPSNILLGSDGRARLADFGIAKSLADAGADLTATGQVIGTASYLAPEVAIGEPSVPASDLYSVGVVLFEMLTGDVPLRGASPMETLLARSSAAAPSMRLLRPDVPVSLDAAIARALDRDPARRFASAAGMRDALTTTDAALTLPLEPARPRASGAAVGERTAVDERTAVEEHTAVDERPAIGERTAAEPRRRRWVWLLAAALSVATATAAFFAVGGSGDGTDPSAAERRAAVTTTTGPPTTTPTTSAATTQPTTPPTTTLARRPQTLTELAGVLAGASGRYGIRQPELRQRILALLSANPGQRDKQASELTREVLRWSSSGQLDRTIAAETVPLLSAVTPPSGGKTGRAPGGKHGDRRD